MAGRIASSCLGGEEPQAESSPQPHPIQELFQRFPTASPDRYAQAATPTRTQDGGGVVLCARVCRVYRLPVPVPVPPAPARVMPTQ